MLATEYAEYYRIPLQEQSETDFEFRSRVADALREKGHIVEAHEAYQDERYEESDNVMDGIFGAVAQTLHGTNYSGNQVGNDIVAGKYVRSEKEETSPEMALLAMLLFSK